MARIKTNGVRLVIGFTSDANRWQVVIPYLAATGLPNFTEIIADFETFVATTLWDLWKLVLSNDTEMRGLEIQPLVAGAAVMPYRTNFTDGTKVGTIAADSTPPQTSFLITYYSSEQIAAGGRTITARSFVGPCPETRANSGIIDGGMAAALQSLGTAMMQFQGIASNEYYDRGCGDDPAGIIPPATVSTSMYLADNAVARHELFTQRRRMKPLF